MPKKNAPSSEKIAVSAPELSPYFEIQTIGPDGKSEIPEPVAFVLKQGEPISIGDGSYGMIFRGKGSGGLDCAIKVLYDNSSVSPKPLDGWQDADIDSVSKDVVKQFPATGLTEKELKTALGKNLNQIDGMTIAVAKLLFKKKTTQTKLVEDVMRYLRSITSSDAADRFRRERDVTVELRKGYGNYPPGVVNVWGGTNMFNSYLDAKSRKDSSNAERWAHLVESFNDNLKFQPSTFVLVMDLYRSLKDLLEKTPNDLNVHIDAIQHVTRDDMKQRGYDFLKALNFTARTCEALLLLASAVEGLKQLHNTVVSGEEPFLHLDIKSGNIFIRRDGLTDLKVVLGDLGNLPPKYTTEGHGIDRSGMVRSGYDSLLDAPGTPNFRSPEQKYHIEVAYAKVAIDSDGKVTLEVRDPKFEDSLLDLGDFVIFSKDKNRTPMIIESIDIETVPAPMGRPRPVKWTYTTTADGKNDPNLVKSDSIQVEFHKRQRHRTDLFGIGAVVYDIITCGQSPERFYESIRKFEGTSVDDIITRYENLKIGVTEQDNPDLLQIFSPFHREEVSEYADNDIVKFIMRCMLYKSPGTFFYDRESVAPPAKTSTDRQSFEAATALATSAATPQPEPSASPKPDVNVDAAPASRLPDRTPLDDVAQPLEVNNDDPDFHANFAVNLLYKEFMKLKDDYLEREGAHKRSALIFGEIKGSPPERAWALKNEVNLLQAFDVDEHDTKPAFVTNFLGLVPADWTMREANRLVTGAFDFFLLAQHVRSYIGPDTSNKNDEPTFLHQMQPRELFIREGRNDVKIDSSAKAYAHKDDYLTDMRTNGLARLTRHAANPFVPSALAGIRREVQLVELPDERVSPKRYCIQSMDASSFNVTLGDGDYLVSNRDLWTIRRVAGTDDEWSFEPVLDKKSSAMNNALMPDTKRDASATIFSRLDPFRYYLDMLGLYLQNFIFAHSAFTTTTRNRIDLVSMMRVLGVPEKFNLGLSEDMLKSKGPLAGLHDIYTRYACILLRLRLHSALNSFDTIGSKVSPPKTLEDAQYHSLDQLILVAQETYHRVLGYFGATIPTIPIQRPEWLKQLSGLAKTELGELQKLGPPKIDRFDIETAVKAAQMIWIAS